MVASTALRERAGLAAAAIQAAEVAAAHTERAEAERRLAPEVAAALVDAGFARHFVPARWGGHAGTFVDFTEAVATVGTGCASAAWCAALYGVYGRMAAHLPEEGQRELWSDSPDVRMAGSITPTGQVRADGTGWRLSGAWPFASGVDHADWVLLGGTASGTPRYFAVPRDAYRVEQTWFNVGMRGTGSNTVVLDDVYVPAHLSYPTELLWRGAGTGSDAPCHTVGFKAVNGLSFVAPVLGAARAALDWWTGQIAGKVDGAGRRARDSVTVQLTLARAAAEVDAAGLLLERAARLADGGDLDILTVSRAPRDFSVAAELLVAAVDRLFRAGGARGQTDGNPVQRAWRDVNCAAGHFALQFEANAVAWASRVFDHH